MFLIKKERRILYKSLMREGKSVAGSSKYQDLSERLVLYKRKDAGEEVELKVKDPNEDAVIAAFIDWKSKEATFQDFVKIAGGPKKAAEYRKSLDLDARYEGTDGLDFSMQS